MTLDLGIIISGHFNCRPHPSHATPEIVENHVRKARQIWNIDISYEIKYWEHTMDASGQSPDRPMPPPHTSEDRGLRMWFETAQMYFPHTDINVTYVYGEHFNDGKTLGVSYDTKDERPYLTILCDGSLKVDYLLAHELGHILYYSTGQKDDPHPKEGDCHHNADPNNLMYPDTPTNPIVTAEQRSKVRLSPLLA